ncbi:tRNA methyl transferase family protein [Mycobacterium xenopi 4042]|uniref:tRNA methyl transferase family protein n=1 Tax=Mycobacterium xenopi 4042 TaxID=1299334 RepID=X7Z5Q0_MYCXE|nr:tRNA methyl transferase family protein [Mycobacterium xenopi 4042]
MLLAMGADAASARGSLRLSLGHTSVDADVDAALRVLPSAVSRARQASLAAAGRRNESSRRDERWCRLIGGRCPDGRRRSRRGRRALGSFASARHVAHRLTRLLLQGRRRRCPPGRRRTRNPFLRMGFRGEVQAGRDRRFRVLLRPRETPNPCVRCNQRIKFSALSARALALGFDAVATGHYARLCDGKLRRAVDRDKDQSYVLAVLTADQLRHAAFPIGDTPKPQIRAEAARRAWRSRKSRTATTSASSRPGTPARFSASASACAVEPSSIRRAPCWPSTTVCTASRSGSAKGWASPVPAQTVEPVT